MPKTILAIYFTLFLLSVDAQISITGRITDTKGAPLPRINIMFFIPETQSMPGFAVTDNSGLYKATLKTDSDSLLVKVSSISHRNQQRIIAARSCELTFILEDEVKDLPGIQVKAPVIEKRGDTISYLVQSFARQQDRSIEDVMRRMPGIEVEPDGKILYEGVPINKFYVEGLDLMEGRYTMISRNLPQGSVSAVEILENHQPVRMLQDKLSSSQAAINLKIKPNITATGTASMAAGVYPALWDVNITPMVFAKQFQAAGSVQANNTGRDAAGQLRTSVADSRESATYSYSGEKPMLQVVSPSPPDIAQNRHLQNNIQLFNLNALRRINRDFIVRGNVYFTHDRQTAKSTLTRTYFLPDDTISFIEKTVFRPVNSILDGKFTINRNVKSNYLNNEFAFRYADNIQQGTFFSGNDSIRQWLSNPAGLISNTLRAYFLAGKHIFEVRSFLFYSSNRQNLTVVPGVFRNILNSDAFYDTTAQTLNAKRVTGDNSAGLVFNLRRLTFSPRAGFMFLYKEMASDLGISGTRDKGDEILNNVVFRIFDPYINSVIEYKRRKLTVNYRFSIDLNNFYMNDLVEGNNLHTSYLLSDNRVTAYYSMNAFWKFSMALGYNSRLSDPESFHSNYILFSCRNLGINAIPVTKTNARTFVSSLSYRNQIISFFNTFTYSYSSGEYGSISKMLLGNEGWSITENYKQPRSFSLSSFQLYSSKYFLATKTTFSLRINYLHQLSTVAVNNQFFSSLNQIWLLKPAVSYRINQAMNLEYYMDASTIYSSVEGNQKTQTSLVKHNLNYFVFPAKNHLLSINGEYYRINNTN